MNKAFTAIFCLAVLISLQTSDAQTAPVQEPGKAVSAPKEDAKMVSRRKRIQTTPEEVVSEAQKRQPGFSSNLNGPISKAIQNSKNTDEQFLIDKLPKMTIDFVGTEIAEVVRSISTAYGLSIVVDRDVTGKVTIHLEDVDLVDGLEAMCASNGFELIREGSIFRIRKASEKTRSILNMKFQRMDLDLQNKNINEFIPEFAKKTGLKILAGSGLEGTISGSWKNQIPLEGFKALMDAHDYKIKKKNGFYIVYSEDGENVKARRRGRRQGAMDVNIEDGKASLILEEADLSDVLREIAEQANLNIVFYGSVRENIDAHIQDATVDEAFSTLLKGSKYSYLVTEQGTILVGDKNPQTPAGKILTTYDLYHLKHIQADEVVKLLPKSIQTPGVLTVIKEQNAVLITGTADEIENVKLYLDLIDIPPPQVLLECIIVEFRRGDEIGYGVSAGRGETGKKAGSGLPRINTYFNHDGMSQVWEKAGVHAGVGFLPDQFDFELSALEKKNKARILARPTVTTLNGNRATINVTNTMYYPIQSVSKDGLPINDFRPINDGITLEITPYVTNGGEVTVNIQPEIKTTSLSSAANGPRDINTRNLNTTVKLQDGETVQLGGLIQSNEEQVREYVPILGSIPLLGYLFSYKKNVETTTELVIYITPYIINSKNYNLDFKQGILDMDQRKNHFDLETDLERKPAGITLSNATIDTLSKEKTKKETVLPPDTTLAPVETAPQDSLKKSGDLF